MSSAAILLVEDEKNLGATLQEYLEAQGYLVDWAYTFHQAHQFICDARQSYQLALFDIGLPDGDGLELARTLRKESPFTVFMFLSAQNDPDLKVKSLDIGAQDYMTKPFNLKELSFRLKRIFSTTQHGQAENTIEIGPLKIWFRRFRVQNAQGELINLSLKECHILKLLFENQPNVVSRDQIIDQIWGQDASPSYRTVDNYIVNLRKWSETDPDKHLVIASVRGVGYKVEIKESY